MQDIRIICFCEKNNSNNNYFPIEKDKIIKCEYCNYYQHKKCISPMNKSQIYICPICQFALFDPYLKIKYHFFIPNIITNKQQGIFSYNFNLENIVFNMNPPNKHNFLILRCLKLTEEGFCFEWPYNIELYINDNNKLIYSINNCFDEYKRKINEQLAFPFFPNEKKINHFIRFIGNASDYFLLNKENTLKINFKKVDKNIYHKYIISLDYIQYINNIDTIMKEVQFIIDKNKLIKLTKCDNKIIEKFDFIDPISKTDIIEVPARGWKCEHIPCFDLRNFFIMQNENCRFCCPICNKKVGLIYIDGCLLNIIEKYKDNYENVLMNGKYEIVRLNEKDKEKDNNLINSNENIFNQNEDIIYLNDSFSENNNIQLNQPIFKVIHSIKNYNNTNINNKRKYNNYNINKKDKKNLFFIHKNK